MLHQLLTLAHLKYPGNALAHRPEGAGQTFADMGNLAGVVKLFSSGSTLVLPAWIHYLAFDLVIGNYLVERNLA